MKGEVLHIGHTITQRSREGSSAWLPGLRKENVRSVNITSGETPFSARNERTLSGNSVGG